MNQFFESVRSEEYLCLQNRIIYCNCFAVSKRILKELKRSDKRARKGKNTRNTFCDGKGSLIHPEPSTPGNIQHGKGTKPGSSHPEPPSDGPIVASTERDIVIENPDIIEGQPGYVPNFSTKDFRGFTPSPSKS